jgi:hypothetical protein
MIPMSHRQLIPRLMTGAAPEPEPAGVSFVHCTFCRKPVPANSFSYRSTAKRLLSATCPSCNRHMTLTALAWRQWSRTNAEVQE